MAFGAGTMLSAVAYELVPESSLSHGVGIGIGLTLGSLAYFIGDRLVDRAGGEDRQQIAGDVEQGSGAAMFVGALLDGVPEAFILGTTIALGGSVSIAFVTAVFVSNVPQGVAGTTEPACRRLQPAPGLAGCGRRSPSPAPWSRRWASWWPTR